MIKSELINLVSEKLPTFTSRDIGVAVNNILDDMCKALYTGDRIEIRGFGSFSLHYLPPRKAHNPKTGEQVITVGKHTPHFKPGKALRERVNKKNSD